MRRKKFQKKVIEKLTHIETLLVRLDIADAEVIGATTLSGDVNDEIPTTDDPNGTL